MGAKRARAPGFTFCIGSRLSASAGVILLATPARIRCVPEEFLSFSQPCCREVLYCIRLQSWSFAAISGRRKSIDNVSFCFATCVFWTFSVLNSVPVCTSFIFLCQGVLLLPYNPRVVGWRAAREARGVLRLKFSADSWTQSRPK